MIIPYHYLCDMEKDNIYYISTFCKYATVLGILGAVVTLQHYITEFSATLHKCSMVIQC